MEPCDSNDVSVNKKDGTVLEIQTSEFWHFIMFLDTSYVFLVKHHLQNKQNTIYKTVLR